MKRGFHFVLFLFAAVVLYTTALGAAGMMVSVNVQRTGKSILQMFAFSFFDGSHICRFLPILRPSTVPRSHFRHPKTKVFTQIINHLYL